MKDLNPISPTSVGQALFIEKVREIQTSPVFNNSAGPGIRIDPVWIEEGPGLLRTFLVFVRLPGFPQVCGVGELLNS